MFKKRDDALWKLQQELLAAEDEEYEEETADEEEELDLDTLDALLEEDFTDFQEEEPEEPLYRNHANGYGTQIRNYANRYGRGSQKTFDDDDYDEEGFEDEEVLYRKDFQKAKRKKRRKNLGLILLAIVEILAIAAIALWWTTWLL